ncbi:MAG: glycosyltransferase family 4 protein [Bacteroidia bacterium]
MKILFLSHRIPWPLKDGGAVAIHNNLKGFLDAGHEVKFLCLNPKKDQTSLADVPDYFTRALAESIPVDTDLSPFQAFVNLFGSDSYHVSRFYHPAFEQRLVSLLTTATYDVVHMEGAFIGQYAPLVREHSPACLVLREHNVEYRIWESMAKLTKNPVKAWYLRTLASRLKEYETDLWRQVDLIAAISPEDLLVFQQVNPNAFLGGVGFDLEPYLAVKGEARPKTLFHLGSMDWLPNKEAVMWLLNSIWPLVHQKFPDWKLFLAGKKMPKDWQRDEASLRVEGEVGSAISFMSEYAVMVVPLQSGSGIRIKTIEAMALGKTVITTSVGLLGLDLEPDKEVLLANTPQEFVAVIARLDADPELAGRIGRAAREKVHSLYTNEKHIARLIEKYRNCGS